MLLFFFFQAEDGIRDLYVTGVQTCALPICCGRGRPRTARSRGPDASARTRRPATAEPDRAPREREPPARHSPGGPGGPPRSEERRVGKEGRAGWSPEQQKEKIGRSTRRRPT